MVVLKMNRVVKLIIGDGNCNCFFRSVAQIVYGDEMIHAKIRELLADLYLGTALIFNHTLMETWLNTLPEYG